MEYCSTNIKEMIDEREVLPENDVWRDGLANFGRHYYYSSSRDPQQRFEAR
jgi:hypothetical protein